MKGRYEDGMPSLVAPLDTAELVEFEVMSANSGFDAAYWVRTAACAPASCPTMVTFVNSEQTPEDKPTATQAGYVSQLSRHPANVGGPSDRRFREAVPSMVAPPKIRLQSTR